MSLSSILMSPFMQQMRYSYIREDYIVYFSYYYIII